MAEYDGQHSVQSALRLDDGSTEFACSYSILQWRMLRRDPTLAVGQHIFSTRFLDLRYKDNSSFFTGSLHTVKFTLSHLFTCGKPQATGESLRYIGYSDSYLEKTTSTRRFFCAPASVSFVARGDRKPTP